VPGVALGRIVRERHADAGSLEKQGADAVGPHTRPQRGAMPAQLDHFAERFSGQAGATAQVRHHQFLQSERMPHGGGHAVVRARRFDIPKLLVDPATQVVGLVVVRVFVDQAVATGTASCQFSSLTKSCSRLDSRSCVGCLLITASL
jgi:hypothetical protein